MKNNQDFKLTFLLKNTPKEVFDAINNVRGWWSEEIEGNTEKLGSEFSYHYKDVHRCKIKITELIPGKKVVWRVLDNYFNSLKTKASGRERKFDSRFPKRVIKRSSASLTWVWFPSTSASMSAQMHGPLT